MSCADGKAQKLNLTFVSMVCTFPFDSVDLQKHVCMRTHSCCKTRHMLASDSNNLETCLLLTFTLPNLHQRMQAQDVELNRGPKKKREPSYFAACGKSATNRSETVNSSSWKCGRRNAIARYAPGLPAISVTSTLAFLSGYCAFVEALA